MTSTAQMVILLILYYIIVGIGLGALVSGDLLVDEHVNSTIVYSGSDLTYNTTIEYDSWSLTGGVEAILSLATLGIDLGLSGFGNFMIVSLFIWVPGIIMSILILFAIRSGSS